MGLGPQVVVVMGLVEMVMVNRLVQLVRLWFWFQLKTNGKMENRPQ